MHPNTVEFLVSGDYGLFTDPLTRVGGQKCSYPIPTYEAMKGVIGSIYWKPTLVWYIDEVRVMNAIRMSCKGMRPIHYQDAKNDLSYYTYLADCAYQVRAHFEWNMNRPEMAKDRKAHKHLDIARNAIEKGGRRDVFLGTRECQALVEPCAFGSGTGYYDGRGTKDFGVMVHGLTYPDEAYSPETEGMMTLRLWRASMVDGVIRFPRPEDCTMTKPIRKAAMKKFTGAHDDSGEVT